MVNYKVRNFLSRVLQNAGTGITGIDTQELSLDMLKHLSSALIQEAQEQLSDDNFKFVITQDGERLIFVKRNGELKALRLMTRHGNAAFELRDESDGTQRLIDLAPMLYGLTAGKAGQVIVVDEIGRSLHPHLTQLIVDMHLDQAHADKPTQLLITTHETNLLDLDILRRDEIWFAEKKEDGSTDLYSLSDFQPRYDKDVRRDYLMGRYGAIPFIGSVAQLQLTAEDHQAEPADAF